MLGVVFGVALVVGPPSVMFEGMLLQRAGWIGLLGGIAIGAWGTFALGAASLFDVSVSAGRESPQVTRGELNGAMVYAVLCGLAQITLLAISMRRPVGGADREGRRIS